MTGFAKRVRGRDTDPWWSADSIRVPMAVMLLMLVLLLGRIIRRGFTLCEGDA